MKEELAAFYQLAREHMYGWKDDSLTLFQSSPQWWRLAKGVDGHPESIIAFIAATDGENKKLGAWKRGDIFAPQTWQSPTKHVRGNIFRPGYERNFHKWGIKYFKECVTA